jgi:hypothetical protein
MQRSAGNAAVTQMLHRGRDTPQSGRAPVSVVQRAHEPSHKPRRTISQQALERLQLAKDAIRYTKALIPDAANQREGLQETAYNSYMRMTVMRNNVFWDLTKLRDKPDEETLTAAKAAYAEGGNCGEHADVVFAYLRANARGERIRRVAVKAIDHTLVIIGGAHEPDSEWVAVDAWPTQPKACLWDDHFGYTADRRGLKVSSDEIADGRSDVDLVRSRIKLNAAGKDVLGWSLDDLVRLGRSRLADDLHHYGIDVGDDPVSTSNIIRGLGQVAAWNTRDIVNWSTRRLELWCASLVEPAVLRRVLNAKSADRESVGKGIDDAHDAGGMKWLWDRSSATAQGHDFRYTRRQLSPAPGRHR